MLLKTNMSLI